MIGSELLTGMDGTGAHHLVYPIDKMVTSIAMGKSMAYGIYHYDAKEKPLQKRRTVGNREMMGKPRGKHHPDAIPEIRCYLFGACHVVIPPSIGIPRNWQIDPYEKIDDIHPFFYGKESLL